MGEGWHSLSCRRRHAALTSIWSHQDVRPDGIHAGETKIEHNIDDAVIGRIRGDGKAEVPTHAQHRAILGQHLAEQAFQPFRPA